MSFEEGQLDRRLLDRADFSMTKKFGELLVNEESADMDETIREALWVAFVMSYGRPFKRSKDRAGNYENPSYLKEEQ